MSEKTGIFAKVNDWRLRVFPERQLFLRSEGRVRFLTIPSLVQVGLCVSALAALSWLTTTSVLVYLRGDAIEARDARIAEVNQAYRTLSTDFSTLEAEIEKRAKLLEERQALLETLLSQAPSPLPVEKKAPIQSAQKEDDSSQPETDTSRAEEPEARDDEETPNTPQMLSVAFDPNDISPAAYDGAARRRALFDRLISLEARQRETVATMDRMIDAAMTDLERAMAPTGIDGEHLLKLAANGSQTAVGGPFLPASGAIEPVFDLADGQDYGALIGKLGDHQTMMEQLIAVPFGKPAAEFYISSRYGKRRDPFTRVWSSHPGVDLAGWPGSKILATAPGTVVKAKWHGAYGRMIEIDHGNGYRTRFGHMSKLVVKKGDKVTRGQHIGAMGKTGRATDTHLHYEVWYQGKLVDPMPFVKEAGDVFKVQKRIQSARDYGSLTASR